MDILIAIIEFILRIDWFVSPVIVLIAFLGSLGQFVAGLVMGNRDRRRSGIRHILLTLLYFIIAWLLLLFCFFILNVFVFN